ncbi:MobC family plasmid mobilization relaxosome protein [Bifidobacterium bifidum]|uniref:MobC family plasmid mobilization relaxosome protein n=1 Tax=Bifidobacterium bifidum TaxID=1681 RepID=UPI003D03C89E
MSWTKGRTRPICRKVMFTPEEWERAERMRRALMNESWYASVTYRRWGEYARERLLYPRIEIPRVVLACDPEAFKSELHRIGVNVNQVARVANLTGVVTPEQVDGLRRQLARITELLEGMERAKEEVEARGGKHV